jgi:Glycosyltransferase 61
MHAFELVNGGDHNPYHLFIYMIANFRVTPWKEPLIYYYPKSEGKLVEQTLALLPSNFIRHTEKQANIDYFPFTPQTIPFHVKANFVDSVFPEDYIFLRELFNQYRKPRVKGKFIYLSRNRDNAKWSTIKNEEELLRLIEPLGFETIALTELSVREQIEVVSSADIVLSPHGAGMIHIVWCDKEATILEIRAKGVEKKRHYGHICWGLEMEHTYFWADTNKQEEFTVDLEELGDYLKNHKKIRNNSVKKPIPSILPFTFSVGQ